MSQLIDKLNRVAKVALQPIGFRAARPVSSEPRILLIARLSQVEKAARPATYIAGADAVLLRIGKPGLTVKALQEIAGSLPDIPWGGWLGDIGKSQLKTLVDSGCDFVVFPASSPVLDVPQNDKIGRILQVESSIDEGLLKAVNELPVDAVLAAGEYEIDKPLTWHHLMVFHHLAGFLTKPLIVPVPLDVAAGELKNIWEAGVDGVVVEADTGQTGRLKELRREINELPPRSVRKRGKAEALLPHIDGETGTVIDTEEEEEEFLSASNLESRDF